MEMSNSDFIHKEFPKRFAKDDFWSQIKRTVNGKPVSENDIRMIINQISNNMSFSDTDHLLDIGCGNGALAARLFPLVQDYTGVDFSTYLLEIANEYFRPNSNINYIENDALQFVTDFEQPNIVDKVLMYGCMSYLSRDDFSLFLNKISQRFIGVNTIFVGNIPDITKAADFFAKRDIIDYDVDNETTPIGVWWDPDGLYKLAADIGFTAEFLKMPEEFYGHHYRFDMILRRI